MTYLILTCSDIENLQVFNLKEKTTYYFLSENQILGKKEYIFRKSNNVYIMKHLNIYHYVNSDSPFQSYSY